MGDPERFSPAPGRGQYDRRQTREQRLAEQRERLVAATARAFALHGAPSVAQVIEIAGVGRGSFYEYFDDVEHARKAAVSALERRSEQVLRAAETRSRTPVERFRALVGAWLSLATTDPAGTLVALRIEPGAPRPLSPIGVVLEVALVRSLDALTATGMLRGARDPWHVLGVAAAAEAFARATADHELAKDRSLSTAPPFDLAAVERSLVEVAVRLLR